ncbi:MAG: polysaccharide deacetylase family protein [Thaumarchaeota archaeon]|nr:polysaccharide deacetylase family protein [Nitrososphaerota archaeon]
MGRLGTLVRDGALMTQGFTPKGVTAGLLGAVGISLHPGDKTTAYPGGKESACCVSLDFDVTRESRAEANHRGTHLLLYQAEKDNIPLTWAICGMTVERDPEPLEAILNSGAPHEIACHTYSHLNVDAASPAELETDFEKWRSVVGGSAPRTFVFPYNKMGNFETIRRLGFTAFRGEERRISPPSLENGICNISPVMYLNGVSGGAVETARRFIDLCVKYRSVFHLWSHPWNLSREGNPDKYAKEVLEPIFSHLREKANRGRVGLFTMGELALMVPALSSGPKN